jgi:hypothetical protein
MAFWLQIVLAVVLVAVAACLIPLLLQLRRTATAVQHLAESARTDLQQVAADVHHLRNRADELADLATSSMELPMSIGRIVAGTATALETYLGRGTPAWLGALLTGLKFAFNLIRRPSKAAKSKEESHE